LKTTDLYIGLMSGTSMDGIDAALVDFSSEHTRILATHNEPWPEAVHRQLVTALELPDPRNTNLTELDNAVGESFARATNRLLDIAGIDPAGVQAIGSHGQTIRHGPDAKQPYSLQIGNPGVLTTETGIDVVADFRSADIKDGGQGAPLVPAFHKANLAAATENRVIVNIGGIANITVLPADPAIAVTGFDTGPGNTLMDAWAQQQLNRAMDAGGNWAASGTCDKQLLEELLADPYFSSAPPKSTGREYFNLDWLSEFLPADNTAAQDIQATLCRLTTATIVDAIEQHAPNTVRLLVCGGGIHNNCLMQQLRTDLAETRVESTALYGIDPDWVEAAAFAWLAKQNLEARPGNLPEVTGANHPVILGKLFKAGNRA
jgi:anhydro-N-acetylmuramic acid kinase